MREVKSAENERKQFKHIKKHRRNSTHFNKYILTQSNADIKLHIQPKDCIHTHTQTYVQTYMPRFVI